MARKRIKINVALDRLADEREAAKASELDLGKIFAMMDERAHNCEFKYREEKEEREAIREDMRAVEQKQREERE